MRHLSILALAGTTAALLTSCGLPTGPAAPSEAPTEVAPTVTIAPPSFATPTPAPSASAPPPPASTPTPSDPSDQPVASRPAAFDKVRVTGTLYPVRRLGDTANVNLYIESRNPDQPFRTGRTLSDGNPDITSNNPYSPDGLRLIDPVAKKAYLPATIPSGSCLCTPEGDTFGSRQSALWVSVTFAAPPASTTSVDVFVPMFGTFSGVPVR